jgi:uncharacterized lipoprotein YmbA
MNRTHPLFRSMLCQLAAAAVVAGCANSRPARFYTLSPVLSAPAGNSDRTGGTGMVLEIGPIEVPAYLERPQIVTRTGANELHVEDFHLWAEPIDRNIARVIAENLSAELATDLVEPFPAGRSAPVDYRIKIEIVRFDASQTGEVMLVARWRILDGQGETFVPQRRSQFSETVDPVSYDGIAAGMSRLLGRLCLELAEAVSNLH